MEKCQEVIVVSSRVPALRSSSSTPSPPLPPGAALTAVGGPRGPELLVLLAGLQVLGLGLLTPRHAAAAGLWGCQALFCRDIRGESKNVHK